MDFHHVAKSAEVPIARWLLNRSSSGVTVEVDKKLDERCQRRNGNITINGTPVLFAATHANIYCDMMVLGSELMRRGLKVPVIAAGEQLFKPKTEWFYGMNEAVPVPRFSSDPRLPLVYDGFGDTLQDGQMVWCGVGNGRSPDGNYKIGKHQVELLLDHTGRNFSFHTVPVTVSYEREPCALLLSEKADYTERRQAGERNVPQVKNKDKRGIIEGVWGEKGEIYLHLGAPISSILHPENFQRHINKAIWSDFKLQGTHFAGYAMLADRLGEHRHHFPFSVVDERVITDHFEEARESLSDFPEEVGNVIANQHERRILTLYAQPVLNALRVQTPEVVLARALH